VVVIIAKLFLMVAFEAPAGIGFMTCCAWSSPGGDSGVPRGGARELRNSSLVADTFKGIRISSGLLARKVTPAPLYIQS